MAPGSGFIGLSVGDRTLDGLHGITEGLNVVADSLVSNLVGLFLEPVVLRPSKLSFVCNLSSQ